MNYLKKHSVHLGLAFLFAALVFAGLSRVASADPGPYRVRPRDTLYAIASRGPAWRTVDCIAMVNNIPYPYTIYVGQRLYLPDDPNQCGSVTYPYILVEPIGHPGGKHEGKYWDKLWQKHDGFACEYQVRRGDNLFRIATGYGISFWRLAGANHLTNPNYVYAGQVLRVPCAW